MFITEPFITFKSKVGSGVGEQLSNYPEFEGSNLAATGTGWKCYKVGRKRFEIFVTIKECGCKLIVTSCQNNS